MSGTSCLYVPKAQAEAIARERDSLREQVRRLTALIGRIVERHGELVNRDATNHEFSCVIYEAEEMLAVLAATKGQP